MERKKGTGAISLRSFFIERWKLNFVSSRKSLLGVNGIQLPILFLKNGETRNINIGFAMTPGKTNQVSVTAVGAPGASVSIVVTQP